MITNFVIYFKWCDSDLSLHNITFSCKLENVDKNWSLEVCSKSNKDDFVTAMNGVLNANLHKRTSEFHWVFHE